MATTTTNFGWDIPQSTDLVKNGATAIAELGQDIDTSMVGLKGGTTGQVLSKTSNTDMAFTWVAQDDSNAIQNAIVDAKGDLIAATANDTPARLAVGGNYGFLQADSTAATGLAWNAGAWINYTPTLSAGFGSFTTATANGYYQRIGKTCVLSWSVSITTNGTAANSTLITLPFTAASGANRYWTGVVREFAVVGLNGVAYMGNYGTQLVILNSTGGYFGANGYLLAGTIVYEVA